MRPTLDQSQRPGGISDSDRPGLGHIFKVLTGSQHNLPDSMCVGGQLPKGRKVTWSEVEEKKCWAENTNSHWLQCHYEYHNVQNQWALWNNLYEKWPDISWHRKILQMILTNDYQGAHQRELETVQWKAKPASCSSVWSSFILRCAVLF